VVVVFFQYEERRLFLLTMETFQVLEVHVSDTDRKGLWPEQKKRGEEPSLAMLLFGRTLSGRSISVAITGLRATLHVRLSSSQRSAGRGLSLPVRLPSCLQPTYDEIECAISQFGDKVKLGIEIGIPFGGYGDGQTELFFTLSASTNFMSYLAKDAVLECGLGCEIIAPGRVFLRETVLFHDFGWEFSSLLTLKEGLPLRVQPTKSRQICRCDLEVWLDMSQVQAGWLAPAKNQLATAPLRIASIDIEVKAPGGGFPDASKREDEIVCIGVHSTILGSEETSTVLCLDPEGQGWGQAPVGTFSCYSTERHLLEGYAKLIRTLDVDIFIGYNLLGFDDQYIWDRTIKVGSTGMTQCGRLKGLETELKEITLSSSALGDNVFHEIRMVGRLTVDMLHYIKPNYKLESYTLNAVSEALLGDACKNDMHYSMITTYAGGEDNRTLAKRCVESPATLRLMRLLPPLDHALVHQRLPPEAQQADLKNMANELWVDHRSQVLDLLTNTLPDPGGAGTGRRTLLADYCRQDCVLPMRLMHKLGTIAGLIAMSRVTHTSMYNLLRRGQQIKVFSSLYRATRDRGIIMTQPPQDHCEIQGATVLEPIRGVHTEPVATLDFAALYPNCFRWGNLCYSTYLGMRDVTDPQPDMPLSDRFDIKVSERTIVSFVRPSVRKGILPAIASELLAARRATRLQMKDLEEGSSEWTNLEKRQLALKVSVNSMYGVLGVLDGAYSLAPVAASTTALGRLALAETQRLCRTEFSEIVSRIIYGDTGESLKP
jgi:hypothetical protein